MPKITERHRQVWQALHGFIRNRGGFVVSPVDASPIRFEVGPSSKLPDELRQMGYPLLEVGTTQKIMPFTETLTEHGKPKSEKVTRDHVGLVNVTAYEFPMPLCRG